MNRNPTNYGSITDPTVGFSGGNSAGAFTSLCDDVAAKILSINTNIKTLQDALKSIGTPRDNAGVRDNIHDTHRNVNTILSATIKDIKKLRMTVPKNDKQRMLQVEKIEENFCDIVSKYETLQKELVDKQKAHLLVAVSIEHNGSDSEDNKEYQKQLQITRDLEFEQEMTLEREQRIKQIEETVLNVNELMRELGSAAHAQGEHIDTLENSIDHAAGNVEAGVEQIIKASRYQTRYRKKLFILILVCIVIASILIAIIVTSLKK